jgi:hypothetical protein
VEVSGQAEHDQLPPVTYLEGQSRAAALVKALLREPPQPVALIVGGSSRGKSSLWPLLTYEASRRSAGTLRRDIAALDHLVVVLDGLDEDATSSWQLYTSRHWWQPDTRHWLITACLGPYDQDRIAALIASRILGIHFDGVSDLPKGLRRLVDGVRAALRLMLIRVLTTLTRQLDALDLVLLMLAIARRFGHRDELGHYPLPAFASMSVVIGETARLC